METFDVLSAIEYGIASALGSPARKVIKSEKGNFIFCFLWPCIISALHYFDCIFVILRLYGALVKLDEERLNRKTVKS